MKKLYYFLFLCCSFLTTLQAQVFPVTVQPQVHTPAPITWYSYANGSTTTSPVTVRLFFTTPRLEGRSLRLHLSIQGNGIEAQSTNTVIGAPPILGQASGSLILTQNDITPYFELQNLQGITPATYGSAIPPGTYQFCFEVFDLMNGNRLSAQRCATVFIVNNDPPILNLPRDESVLTPLPAEHIVFQWTPRHINASNVSYTLRIVEIWDQQVDAQTAFLSSIPFFETTTRATSFRYGPAQPLLLPNKRYAWQVQATALQGTEEIGLFKNQGKSEIFEFTRATPCPTPTNVYGEPHGNSKINLYWDTDPNTYSEYTIAYREANTENALWFTKTTNSTWATLWNLKPDTTYEFTLKGKCEFGNSKATTPQEVTTGKFFDENAAYNCGIVPDEIAITNRNPKENLLIFDQFSAGDFQIVITDISQQNAGRITGAGFVRIPYFENARFAVTFSNILINTDMQLAQGEVVTVYDAEFGEGAEMTVDVNVDIEAALFGDQGDTKSLSVPFIIKDILPNKDGALVITGTNGEEAIIPGGERVTIIDNGGTGTAYIIDEEGNVTETERAPGGAATAANTEGMGRDHPDEIPIEGVRVDFQESGYYYFDAKPEVAPDKFKQQYNIITMPDGDHYVQPYKALSNFQEDSVTAKATITDTTYIPTDIIFKTKDGVLVPSSWEGDVATLQLKKSYGYAIEDVLAVVPSKTHPNEQVVVGALSLISLHTITNPKVVILPINDAYIPPDVIAQINSIYKKAGVAFDITVAPSITLPAKLWNNNGMLDIGDSGILSTYTKEEKAINAYIKKQPNFDKEASYILVFGSDIPISDTSTQGFMPLKRQFGYVFNPTLLVKTIAHELGHGVFGLKHPYEEFGFQKGSTAYLMDRGPGTLLHHIDWKQMHEPGAQINWFQKDEDGALVTGNNDISFSDIDQFASDPIFDDLEVGISPHVSPSGVVIILPTGAIPTYLSHNNSLKIAEGVVSQFVLNGKTYKGWYNKTNNVFTGYKENMEDAPYEFETVTETSIQVTLGYDVINVFCGKILISGDYNIPAHQNTTGIGPILREQDIQLSNFLERSPALLPPIQKGCLPEIQRTDFDDYIFGKFNFFGKRGFLRLVHNTEGSISYVYSNIDNEGDLYQLQYLPDNGQWYYVPTPSTNCTSCDLNRLFNALYNPREIGHFLLDTAGMVPIAGELFDTVNGVWYIIEGDHLNAAISFASTVPLVYASTGKYIGKIVKLADGSYSVTKFGTNSEAFLNQLSKLDLDANSLKLLNESFTNKEFADLIIKNPELVNSWKILSNGKASLRNIDNIKAIDAFKQANPNVTDKALQTAFESIKSSGTRRQAFVNALKSCADNKNLIGSLQKTRLATVEEIKDALNKIRNYRAGKAGGGNLGYLEGDIPNVALDNNKLWESISFERAELETHIFDAIEATGSSGSWVRITDSEYRMLNDLAKKLGGVKNQVNDKVTGTLKIVSENPYCTSCQGVIQQFSEMFPKIEITLIDGVR